jgi:hypothetical protein
MKKLLEMLAFKRPARSKTEADFIEKFIVPSGATRDGYGNLILTVGKNPTTLFSAHTDSVHVLDGKQLVQVTNGVAALPPGSQSNCLGADDATGVFILLELIAAEVEGLYIFHRDEEIGGLGSAFIAKETPEVLRGIERAVAFDRRHNTDIIASQSTGTCCSDEFATCLAAALGAEFEPAAGIFTDTANYTHLVPECTNISVGYDNEHTPKETQDLRFLETLIPKLTALNWDALPTLRDPLVFDDYMSFGHDFSVGANPLPYTLIEEFVFNNPQAAVDLLYEFGICEEDIQPQTQQRNFS